MISELVRTIALMLSAFAAGSLTAHYVHDPNGVLYVVVSWMFVAFLIALPRIHHS